MSGDVRRAWQSATARLADLAGWSSFDAGEQHAAAQYFLVALQIAGEAGDLQQRTHTATSMCRQLAYTGHVSDALDSVDLARLSWRHLPALGRAAICIVEARAHARAGNTDAALHAIDDCDTHFHRGHHDADQPTWGYYADEGQILGDAGHAMYDLAMAFNDSTLAQSTIQRIASAYATHPIGARRSKALTMIRIASLQARHGDPRDACRSAAAGLDDAELVWSSRVADDLRVLGAEFNHVTTGSIVSVVADLRGRIDAALTRV